MLSMINIGQVKAMDGIPLLEDVKLLDAQNNAFNSQQEVSFSSTFKIRFELKDLIGSMGIELGKEYVLGALPETIKKLSTESTSWEVKLADGDVLGNATVNNNGQVSFNFVMNNFDDYVSGVTDTYIEFDAQLDKDKCGKSEEIDISFIGAKQSYKIMITENKPKAPIIQKAGVIKDGVILWTVDIAQGGLEYNNGFLFKDQFSNNQDYVDQSFQIFKIENNSAVEVPAISLNIDAQNHTITCADLTDDFDYQIKYKTKFNIQALINDDGKTVPNNKVMKASNKAELYDNLNSSKIAETSQELDTNSGVNWVIKESDGKTTTDSFDNAYTTWKVTVNTNQYSFKDMILTDIITSGFPKNSSASQLSIVTGSLKINDQSVSWQDNQNNIVNANNYQWTLNINKALQKDNEALNGIFVITYQTQITNYSEYIKYNQDAIKNKASLDFKTDFGIGVEKDYGVPGVEKSVSLTKGILKKSFLNYDSSSHQMTWKIIVNENKSVFDSKYTNISIKDVIGDEHSFVKIQNVREVVDVNNPLQDNPITNYTILKDSSNKNIEVIFPVSVVSDKQVVFEIVTKIDDPDYYENNNDTKKFVNHATLYMDTEQYSSVQATAQPKITVLSKEAKGYDYKDQNIAWNIQVNKDNMELKDAFVEDKLIAGLKLVDGSLKLNDGVSEREVPIKQDGVNQNVYYTYENNELKVYLGTIQQSYTLIYKTNVDIENGVFDNHSFNNYNGIIKIENGASLNKSTSQPTSVKATQEITNKALEKTGTPDKDEQKVNYKIIINQSQHTMNETLFTDILSPGLQLSLPSLHLYEATVKSDGAVEANLNKEVKDIDYSTTILGTQNSYNKPKESTCLSITVPKNNGVAYILEYSAYVKDFTLLNYSNQINGEGLTPGGNITVSDISSQQLGVGSGANASKIRAAVFTLKDSQNNNRPLVGVEFELFYNGKVIDRQTTNQNGEVTFIGLEEGKEYVLKQVTHMNGYEDKLTEVSFFGPKAGMSNKYTQTLTNNKLSLLVSNIDEENKKIENSEFSLYQIPKEYQDQLDINTINSLLINENLITKEKTNRDGNISFNNQLEDGIYVIAQTDVEDQYNLSKDRIIVKIKDGLIVKLYHVGDNDETFNNCIINKKRTAMPENPIYPDISNPILKPGEIPIKKPSHQVVGTQDSTYMNGIVIGLITSTLCIIYLKKKRKYEH